MRGVKRDELFLLRSFIVSESVEELILHFDANTDQTIAAGFIRFSLLHDSVKTSR